MKNKHLIYVFTYWFKINTPIRFILVGGYNTVIAYLLFSLFYYLIGDSVQYLIILLLSYIIGISHNFITFKFFVFKTKGNYLQELFKNYISYSFLYVINAILLYIFVDFFYISAYASQLIIVCIMTVITYFIHKHFSFKTK